MSRLREIRRVAIILGIAAALAEAGSYGALHALDLWPEGTFEDAYRTYAVDSESVVLKGRPFPHPFFGPLKDKAEARTVNNYGFITPESYPYERKPGDFVIGLFGGSFANLFAIDAARQNLFAELSERVPWLAGRRIVLLNLAANAGKQPQQFFIASYFTRMVDLLVNLDGYSEISNFYLAYPLEYPSLYHVIYGAGAPTDLERAAAETAAWIPAELGRAALSFAPLRASSAYLLLWKSLLQADALLTNAIARRMRARKEVGPPYKLGFDRSDPRELSSAIADIWERYTRLEHEVARAEGKQTIFFLQPNAYVRPGKPLSPEERGLGLGDNPAMFQQHSARFMHLRQRARKLSEEGVAVFDLSGIFESETRPIYRDKLCHLRPLGNRILARRMVNVIARVLTRDWKSR